MKPPTVFLGEMTNREVEAFVKAHRMVIVPTGAVEQHGPHGPLLTDVLIPNEVARRAARWGTRRPLVAAAAAAAATPAAARARHTARLGRRAVDGERRKLLEHLRGAAARARDHLLARADELLEVVLALHAGVLVDRHDRSVVP